MTKLISTSLRSFSPFALSLLACTACDAQVDSEYHGEPLASLTGQVLAMTATSADQASLLWSNFAQAGDTLLAEAAPVEGEFPAQFTLDVFLPPPADMLNHFEGDAADVGLGLAYIVAYAREFDGWAEETPTTPWGIAADHVLAYAPNDLPEGSLAADFAGAPLAAGFHVLDVLAADDPACPQNGYQCLRPAAAGMATSIAITIDEPEATLARVPNVN